jgi:hypothetical protein
MDFPQFDEYDLSSMALKYCTSAPFSAELKAEVVRRMPGALIEIYSMTEGRRGVPAPRRYQPRQAPHRGYPLGR